MIDTSIIERKIRDQVMDMCFNAIVCEAFISGLPIHEADLTDGLTRQFVGYATECLKDLGGASLMKEALDRENNPAKKKYLNSMHELCMETARDVTSRILKDNPDDEDLKAAAANVSMTPKEYAKFSTAAAKLTPAALTSMIQKKTLDTIKDEKEAYQKDAELEEEITAALKEGQEDETSDLGDIDTGMNDNTGEESGEHSDDDILGEEPGDIPEEDSDIPPLDAPDDESGDKIGTESFLSGGGDIRRAFNVTKQQYEKAIELFGLETGRTKGYDIEVIVQGFLKFMGNDVIPGGKMDLLKVINDPQYDGFCTKENSIIKKVNGVDVIYVRNKEGKLMHIIFMTKSVGPYYAVDQFMRNNVGKMLKKDPHYLDEFTGNAGAAHESYSHDPLNMGISKSKYAAMWKPATESAFVDAMNASDKNDGHRGIWIGRECEDEKCCKKSKSPSSGTKAQESFDNYMRSVAGESYRHQHDTFFSKLYELAYEAILATNECFTTIPFEAMADITKRNTFKKFSSNKKRSLEGAIESIGLYAFESVATPDGPEADDETLSNAMLTASIIYTFFETLNSMNLYCPGLNEVRNFVDENINVSERIEMDKAAFMDLFRNLTTQAKANIQRANTVPEIDAVQKDLDIVRERTSLPGFEKMQGHIADDLNAVQESLNAKRDKLIAATRPVAPATESATQLMKRTRDTMKFSRVASTYGRKPNVRYMKMKIDPQGKSPYVAVECYAGNNSLANKTTIVLESGIDNLPAYVTAAIEGSSLKDLNKHVMVTDVRSGKSYFDKDWVRQ